MSHLQFSTTLDPKAPAVLPDAITFETGATLQQVRDPDTFAYNHHGPGFGDASPGALTSFFEDLVLGRRLPTKFVARQVDGMDTIVAMALFLHRELAIEPRTPGFVAEVDFLHRRGLTVIGHVSPEVEQLVYLLNDAPEGADPDWLGRAIGWVRAYLTTGEVPGTMAPAKVQVIDIGTDGFVVATTKERQLLRAWVELYRRGYLRGVVFGKDTDLRRPVLISRKSPYVAMDLVKAATVLNEMEAAMLEPPDWSVDVEGGWLASPKHGTLILPEHLIQVLQRV